VETIRISSENLLTVINDILDFSKIEQGKMTLEKMKFNLREGVNEAITLLKPIANKKRLYLKQIVKPDVPEMVIGDKKRLVQVLLNLINNAIKFTLEGGVELNVSVSRSVGDKTELLFKVKDTGIGIPEEKMDELFQSFSQIDSSISRKFEGTGLGLVISKRIVNLMGGDIKVESEVGKGSVFSFTILVETIHEISEKEPDQDKEKTKKSLVKFKGAGVLVAEDNLINQKVTSSLLKNMGITPDVADNGKKAVDACKNKQYHVVLMDIQMPEMDGLEATRKILDHFKSIEADPPVIIAMTANVLEDAKQQCFNAGMSGFIAKPVSPFKLEEVLSKWLKEFVVEN
jgi:CheY-like chemotaxis protein